jgi:putative spermidine/putrescine transport system substrate-binding protein
MKKKKITRRDFLKKSGKIAGLAAAGSYLSGTAPLFVKNAFAEEPLRVIGLAIGPIEPIMKKASEDLGFEVIGKTMSNQAMILMGTTAPDEFDVAEEYFNDLGATWPAGNYQPIDTTKIANWDKLGDLPLKGHLKINEFCDSNGIMGKGYAPRRRLFVTKDGKYLTDMSKTSRWTTMAPTYCLGDALGYNAEKVPPVKSWAPLLDPKYKGVAALCTFPPVGINDVALSMQALGLHKFESMGDFNKKEIDIVVDHVIKLKKEGHFRAFWETFNQSVSLMTSGEVVIQSMWYPAVNAARAAGIDCRYGNMYDEGYRGFMGGMMISKKAKGTKLEKAYKYINWALSGWYGAQMVKMGYHMSVPETAQKFMPADEWAYWNEGKPAKSDIKDFYGGTVAKSGDIRFGGSYEDRMGRIVVWNGYPTEIAYMIKRWNEMKSA